MTTRDSITFPENIKSKYESQSDLMVAIELSKLGDNFDIAKSLLENYKNINEEDEEGKTLLIKTLLMDAKYVNTKIIIHIIEKGANVNKTSNPFINAIIGTQIRPELMKHVNNYVNKRYSQYIPLILATQMNYVDVVKKLFEQGANIEEKNSIDETMLYAACRNGNLELVELALQYKANINSALYAAIFYKKPECVKLLLNVGADIFSNENKDSFDKVIEIANSYELTNLFFEKGAKIEMLREKGFFALKKAIERNDLNLFELLINNGVDVNQENPDFLPAFTRILRISKNDSHEKMIRLMIKKVKYDLEKALSNTDSSNKIIISLLKGESTELLTRAIKSKNINMIKILIVKDSSNETFIEIIKLNDLELIKFYFENVKPLLSLNDVLDKLVDESINFDILKCISENLK